MLPLLDVTWWSSSDGNLPPMMRPYDWHVETWGRDWPKSSNKFHQIVSWTWTCGPFCFWQIVTLPHPTQPVTTRNQCPNGPVAKSHGRSNRWLKQFPTCFLCNQHAHHFLLTCQFYWNQSNLQAICRTCFPVTLALTSVNMKMIQILLEPVNVQAICRTYFLVQHDDDTNFIGTSQCTINSSN